MQHSAKSCISAGRSTEFSLVQGERGRSAAVDAVDDAVDDASLVARARSGDARAFAELLGRHQDVLRRAALRRTRNAADADDVVQETALKAWQRLDSLREPGKVRAWLLQIAVREALSTVLARREDHELTDDAASVSGPDSGVDRFDLHDGLRAALRALPRHQARAWLLREADGLSYREIAERLDASESSVRSWLVLARKRVQRGIDECCPSARPSASVPSLLQGGFAVPPVQAVKAPVAGLPPRTPDGRRSTAGLRSPMHQDIELVPASATDGTPAPLATSRSTRS